MFRREELLMKLHLRGTACPLPHEITVLPDRLTPIRSEHTLPLSQPDRPVLDLPTSEGWKAELT